MPIEVHVIRHANESEIRLKQMLHELMLEYHRKAQPILDLLAKQQALNPGRQYVTCDGAEADAIKKQLEPLFREVEAEAYAKKLFKGGV